MPDLLLVCFDNQSCFELDEIAKQSGFRARSTFEIPMAEEWLKTLPFDALAIDARFGVEKHQALASQLWKRTPLAPLIVFDLDPKSDFTMREARLFGAEVARGPNAKEEIARRLQKIVQSGIPGKPVNAADFGVMVVEDLDSPRDIICMFIESLGYPRVSGWRSAREAMDELLANPDRYGCVVTDIRMPEISGRDLIEFIRSNDKLAHLPIIVLTAYGTVDMLIDCLRAGATGFLIKPPKKKDLGWELSRALRISTYRTNPRLASFDEAEAMRDLLIDRGFA